MKTSPTPWTIDHYRNVLDANKRIVKLTGVALTSGIVPRDHECHGNTALLVAAPLMRDAIKEVIDYFEGPDDGCLSDAAFERLKTAYKLATEAT